MHEDECEPHIADLPVEPMTQNTARTASVMASELLTRRGAGPA
jgi:hypothetical protein